MSMIAVTPNADNIVELEWDKHYFLVHVQWEWSETRYVIELKTATPTEDDVIEFVKSMPRRQDFRIMEFSKL